MQILMREVIKMLATISWIKDLKQSSQLDGVWLGAIVQKLSLRI